MSGDRGSTPHVHGRGVEPRYACPACFRPLFDEGYCPRCIKLGNDKRHRQLTRNA